jgi:hypothetical protein
VIHSKHEEHLQIMKLKKKDKSEKFSSIPNKKKIKFQQTLSDRMGAHSNLKEALILNGIVKSEEFMYQPHTFHSLGHIYLTHKE